MEEGTGLGLYILVAAILFGLFALALTIFGDEVNVFLSNLFSDAETATNANLDTVGVITPR